MSSFVILGRFYFFSTFFDRSSQKSADGGCAAGAGAVVGFEAQILRSEISVLNKKTVTTNGRTLFKLQPDGVLELRNFSDSGPLVIV